MEVDHEYWEERLQGFLDKELEPADHKAVEAHIQACEDCSSNLSYFRSMKGRLQQHAEFVEMPRAVEQRIQNLFEKKRQRARIRPWISAAIGLAAAAALILFVLQPKASFGFETVHLIGTITCHDCELASRVGVTKGELCKDGHCPGLVTDDGKLWRIATDSRGSAVWSQGSFYGKEVEIEADALRQISFIRIKNIEPVNQRQASL